MSVRTTRRGLGVAAATATAALVALVGLGAAGLASAAKPPAPPAQTNSNCPTNPKNLPADANVNAFFTTSGGVATYVFVSTAETSTSQGVPGLINYCVYPSTLPDSAKAEATGADGSAWVESNLNKSAFSFSRPGGDKTNIPLDGKTVEIGTATWNSGTVPTPQTIVLHISDQGVCTSLNGGVVTPTCFVLPKPGPVCDAASGDANTAYDSYPKDVLACTPPSYAFEGNFANEFGDQVTLGAGGTLQSMKVVFNSYGCGDSGRWYTANCVTTAGEVFTVPGGITAKIYDPSGLGGLTTPIATTTINPSIPFRPSAIPDTSCPNNPPADAANSRWLNPASGICEYSAKVLLTFPFSSGPTLTNGHTYVWTVAFNTTHSGYSYIGENTTCFNSGNPPGCGYDSLNVGYLNYPNAPYAGTDPDNDVVFLSHGGTPYSGSLVPLGAASGFTGLRPLGEIIVGP
jgi:hypothetical protein